MADMTVWKFEVPVADEVGVQMPSGAQVIHVAPSHVDNVLLVWAIVWPDAVIVTHRFYVRGTGHPLRGASLHLGSVQSGPFVWHLFDGLEAS